MIKQIKNIYSKANSIINEYPQYVKLAKISFFLILTGFIITQSGMLIFQNKIKQLIKTELEKYSNESSGDFYIKYGSLNNSTKFLKSVIDISNIEIGFQDFKIKSKLARAECDIISCIFRKITITPDFSASIKTSNQSLLLSFESSPKLTIKHNPFKTYINLKFGKYEIFNADNMEKIATIDKSKLMIDIVNNKNQTKLKSIAELSSSDLFNLDYFQGNDRAFFLDTGSIGVKYDIEGIIGNKENSTKLSRLKINQISINTSNFKIKADGNFKDEMIDLQIDLYKTKNIADYFGTLVLNTPSDSSYHKMTLFFIKKLNQNSLKNIIDTTEQNSTIKISTDKKTKSILINSIPLNQVIFNMIAYE